MEKGLLQCRLICNMTPLQSDGMTNLPVLTAKQGRKCTNTRNERRWKMLAGLGTLQGI